MAKKKSAAKRGGKSSTGKVKKSAKKAATKKSATKKSTAKKSAAGGARGKKSSRRELIDTGRDKRYVRRDAQGQFNESDDVGRSLSQDRRRQAKGTSKPGQGDRGDRAR